ncbi:MAG: hypothetical protein L0287_34240 [Anaerolineae bacterium]|nr:hypothetical protein [Anaerolineae bacterium]MCI0607668.1 hypothetical protein [Anaerolineae bacterium]
MMHKIIITNTVVFIAISAIAELLFPSKLLAFVGITSNLQTAFLLRTTAVALVAFLPSLWTARNIPDSASSRSALFGVATYIFLSSAVDFQAFTQGIVNSMPVLSIMFRVILGMIILWLLLRSTANTYRR